nr:RNA-directed DNA polymerase, eukaryota [Tanacetum cinerariifolium]
MLNKKPNQRSIRGIMVNGTWIDDPVKVKYEFLDHFRNMFDKPPENRARIDICFPNVLSNNQRDDLERMVTKEEVKKAVWDCGSDKSPDPHGFSFTFFRHFWSTIEKDIFQAVDCFFMNRDMPNGCNSNFIALIPKIIDANMVKDFRPISLIGSLYKVIAKILTNRLVNVIGGLVNEVQSAFVAERQILDGPFILNEVIQWYFWSFESERDYSVASIRKLIDEKRFREVGISTRWVKSVPRKVNITAWKIKTNALPTRFNLSRRGMDIDTLMCPVCKGGVETTSHLFFQCVLSKQIMRKVSSWWNVDYTDVSSYEEWRVWLVSIRIPNKLKSRRVQIGKFLLEDGKELKLSRKSSPSRNCVYLNQPCRALDWCCDGLYCDGVFNGRFQPSFCAFCYAYMSVSVVIFHASTYGVSCI